MKQVLKPASLALAISSLLLTSVSLPAFARGEVPVKEQTLAKSWNKHKALKDSSQFKGLQWRNIGPTSQGGRIVDIAAPSDEPYTFYVAFASGGLWKTTNNGASFEPIFDDMPTNIMGDIAIAPSDSNVVWVGTGENNSSRSSYGGFGVYRSVDGGKTWENKGLNNSDRIGRIIVDPKDPNHVYVAAIGKLYTEGGQRGIYETKDGGDTWAQILEGDDDTGFIDLVVSPNDSNVLFAASWERSRKAWNFVEGGDNSAIWRSTDAGKTWKRLGQGFPSGADVGRIGLAMSAAAPNVVYASVDHQGPREDVVAQTMALNVKALSKMDKTEFLRHSDQQIEMMLRRYDLQTSLNAKNLREAITNGSIKVKDLVNDITDNSPSALKTPVRSLEVYRSDDLGETWTKTHKDYLPGVYSSYGYYFGELRVSPKNPDRIYSLGVKIIRSDDAGKTWHSLDASHVHADNQAMWIDPNYPDRVLLGNDGGLDISYDGGDNWQRFENLPVGQFYTVNVDMDKPYKVYGGMQDNGTWKGSSVISWDENKTWSKVLGGDGMHVAIDPRDSSTLYSGYQFGYSFRADKMGYHSIRPRDTLSESAYRYNWNTPVILSPHNPDVLYFGANKVLRSMDKGDSWTAISGDITTSKKRGDVPFGTITTLSESPKKFGVIWAGTDDGNIRATANGGASWVDVTRKLPKGKWVSRVEASRYDVDRAYIALNGYRDDDIRTYIYRTENFGKSWKNIASNLPNEAVNVIKEDPVNENILYVGTDHGVYVSHDKGGKWQQLGPELPNVPVHDLIVHPRDREIVVGTHGRSIWIADVLPVQNLTSEVKKSPLHLFYIDPQRQTDAFVTSTSYWAHEQEKPSLSFYFWSNKSRDAKLSVTDKQGNELYTATVKTAEGINHYEWNYLVVEKRALDAEKAANAGKSISDVSYGDQPYQQAKAYGIPSYLQPGTYTISLSDGNFTTSTTLSLKAMPALKARKSATSSIRGEK